MKEDLNKEQYEAVTTTDGAVLVLAGAGTGKTRVITYRIAYLIKNLSVNPNNILAVTFTNKAAAEMKKRLADIVGGLSKAIFMGTFHSICLNILRKDGEYVGLAAGFGIVDQEDRLAIVRQAVKDLNLDVKAYPPKQYLYAISAFKNTQDYVENRAIEDRMKGLKDIYKRYQETLSEQNVIDFDDMISLTVRLFLKSDEVLNSYRELFKYILVDEYQDTNAVQFKFLYLLSGANGNLCVVGDDDQSIYGWRGAEVRNILDFDSVFPNTKEVKLIGNYRSGKEILDIANNLIEQNRYRRGKRLISSCDKTSSVIRETLNDERAEADYVVRRISEFESAGKDIGDVAILYRTNAQSRNFEVALNRRRIAYKVVGGIGFYQRREIKDILSYLRIYDNPYDIISFKRSMKNPSKFIGDATIDKIVDYASEKSISILEALTLANLKGKQADSVNKYLGLLSGLANELTIKGKIDKIVQDTDYHTYIKQFEEADEAERREDNIKELYSAAAAFEEEEPNAKLSDFLANTTLITSGDEQEQANSVKLMTIHAAKGLEFDVVFLTGLEEGLFPLSSAEGEGNIEEERRLCYVGITRAERELHITNVTSRFQYGKHQLSIPSRFLRELALVDSEPKRASSYSNVGGSYSDYIKKPTVPDNLINRRVSKAGSFNHGAKVLHNVFGEGTVVSCEGTGATEKVTVMFKKSGLKKILASFIQEI